VTTHRERRHTGDGLDGVQRPLIGPRQDLEGDRVGRARPGEGEGLALLDLELGVGEGGERSSDSREGAEEESGELHGGG
jgi:hypothetical protein